MFFVLILSFHLLAITFAQQPTFNIGVLATPDSTLGRGAQLKVQEINRSGGAQGADGTFFQLQLVFTPISEQANPSNAVTTLATSNVIAVIGSEINTAIPLLQSLNVPILTTSTDDSLIINDQTDLVIRTRATDFLIERALADYLINSRNINQIQVMQFDAQSTVKILGFVSAVGTFGVPVPQPTLIINAAQIESAVQNIMANPPQVVVGYGDPEIAGAFYFQLRAAGYTGLVTYPQPDNPQFRGTIQADFFEGIISSNTWSYGADDKASDEFMGDYVRTFGTIPDPIAAAGADSINLLATAIGRPGELRSNLLQLNSIIGVQGLLSPGSLNPGETSNNIIITEINPFGAPRVVARFAGIESLSIGEPDEILITQTPTPTATPEGVVATIISNRQNVRTGPSTDFQVLGQIEEGEQVQVIGTSIDYNWLVIDFRGRQGWIANLRNLNEVFGDLNTVPIIIPPATPTPVFTATPAPPQNPDIVIQSASVAPNPIVPNQEFTLTVNVSNNGANPAGNFAIAANMPPNNVLISTNISGLGAGQTTTVTMTGTLQNTGQYSVAIVADLNNQVNEGVGEDNNDDYIFSYRIDRPIVKSGSGTIAGGNSFNLSDDVSINWDGQFFNATTGNIGFITGVSYDNVHYDLISSSIASQSFVEPSVGNLIGVRNADGKRGVARVDAINGSQISITYKAYSN